MSACTTAPAIASGNHPDVRVWDVPDDAKTFKVEQVRELLHAVSSDPLTLLAGIKAADTLVENHA